MSGQSRNSRNPPSQETIQAIEALTTGGVFAVDADKNIIAFGPEMERLTGYDASDVLGRYCLSALRCEQCLRGCGVYDHGAVSDVAMTLYRRDGSEIQVRKSGRALRTDKGERWALERIKLDQPGDLEIAPVDPLDAVDLAMRALGRWFVVTDSELRIIRCSADMSDVVGRSERELVGLPLAEILSPGLVGEGADFRRAVLSGERREGRRATLLTAHGGPLAVSVSAAPVGDTPGAPAGTCGAPSAAVLVVMRPEGQQSAAPVGDGMFEGMVARAPAMHRIFRLIEHLHDSDATVLITGESGTGKELVAKALHARSRRAAGPFVAINCGALPETLLESELFGYVQGAFTGAARDKPGRFELADGGTVFLDEIGDMPLPVQVKVLRIVQERTFERLGDTRTRTVDVRILAATHKNLEDAVAENRFRDDLYYRLRVVPIEVPPLRERPEDMEPLIVHLLDRIGLRRGRALRLSPASMKALLTWPWPGNVRELENVLEYATAVCEGQTIHPPDLPAMIRDGQRAPVRLLPAQTPIQPLTSAGSEAAAIRAALNGTAWKRQEAAEELGMSRWTLWRKMKEYGILPGKA